MLVVASKIKKQLKAGGCNTSASAITKLSEVVEQICVKAMEAAKKDRRKTVMDRDIEAVLDGMI